MALKNELNEDAEPLGEPSSLTCRPEEQVERSMDLPTRLRRFFQCFLKSQSGFSLAELMVAAGVTGTLALGTLKLADLQTQAQMTDELISAQQSVQLKLKNSSACFETLNGINASAFSPYNGTVNAKVPLPQGIKNPKLPTQPIATVALARSPSWLDIQNNNESLISRTPNYVVFGNTVMVQDISITSLKAIGTEDTETNKGRNLALSGVVEISIIFAVKDSRKPAGAKIKRVTKHYYAPVTFSRTTGVIDDCKLPEDIGIQETEEELCEILGGSFDTINGRCIGAEEKLTDTVKGTACCELGGSFSASNNSCVPAWFGCKCGSDGIIGFQKTGANRGKPICKTGTPTGCLVGAAIPVATCKDQSF